MGCKSLDRSSRLFLRYRQFLFDHVLNASQPTVIPLHPGLSSSYTPNLAPESFKSVPANAPGRYRSISEYHALYVSGELTPLAVVEALLPLIRRDIDQPSNHSVAFIDCHSKAVLEAAKASTLRYQQGKPLSSEWILRSHHLPNRVPADYITEKATHGRSKFSE
jgi:hypothetical protein